jgi:hypothetical protein
MRLPFLALLFTVGLLSGCMGTPLPEEELEALDEANQSLAADNGANLNGANLNGANLNGANLNSTDLSRFLVSISYGPAKRQGMVLDTVWLEGTTFHGQRGATQLSGADFVGVEFVGNLGNGSTRPVRIASVSAAPAPNQDLLLYDIEYRGWDGAWRPACRDASGTPVPAIPVEGTWDYRMGVETGGSKTHDLSRFTFACQGGAIAKCVLWGYRPWATRDGVSLAPYHQACTRMVRADYCGDGTSHTRDGNRINLYDTLGIQQDTESWTVEAEWDEHGARCVSPINRAHTRRPCYDLRVDWRCGKGTTPGLLRNETPFSRNP